jgi:hypothetical protein
MNLSQFTKEQLQEELNKRLDQEENKPHLVIAIGGKDGHSYFTECLKLVKDYKDMPDLSFWSLRARLNSHRFYKLFYFKTDQENFDILENKVEEKNVELSIWLNNTATVRSEWL